MADQETATPTDAAVKTRSGIGPLLGLTFLLDAIAFWVARAFICHDVLGGSALVCVIGNWVCVLAMVVLLALVGGLYQGAGWARNGAIAVLALSIPVWVFMGTRSWMWIGVLGGLVNLLALVSLARGRSNAQC